LNIAGLKLEHLSYLILLGELWRCELPKHRLKCRVSGFGRRLTVRV
jgi:hypothetical protein